MFGPIVQGELFVVQIVFDLYTLVLLLRMILQWRHANFFHPVSQFVIKLTDPVVLPLRQILPRFRSFDISTAIAVLTFQVIKFILLFALAERAFPGLSVIIISALAAVCRQIINLFFYAILLRVILSWLNSSQAVVVLDILYLITEPLLKPARRMIPPIAGFDISPIVILILLKLISVIIVQLLYTLI